jgi:hypothetical protein
MARRSPSFRECFLFPLSTPQARQDVLVGGLLLCTLLPGWILNLGHRLDVVYRVHREEAPYFRGFAPWGKTFARGLTAALAIAVYLSPSGLLGASALALYRAGHVKGAAIGGVAAACAFVLAIYVLPGGMTYNAAHRDIHYLYRPDKALRRAIEGGRAYLWAWLVGGCAMALTTFGLLALGIGFLFTSVWAWSVVGYAFSKSLALAEGRDRTPDSL